MPRPTRMESAGAFYHILNRGNYRQELFTVGQSGQQFEQTLFEACGRFGWKVHAYVLMSNHYHLALETPESNLAVGMQWLQSTFANRFNRMVHERGHVFQGRFKSLVIEDGSSLLAVVNYIHLNPVRARLVRVEDLRDYAMSSFPKYFWGKSKCPACLCNAVWLLEAGRLKPTCRGMRCYQAYLAHQEEADPGKREALYRRLCRGWYIGTQEGKQSFLDRWLGDGDSKVEDRGLGAYGEDAAGVLLGKGLLCLGKSASDLEEARKGAVWKVILACWIKDQTGVSNRWLGEHVHLGASTGVSRLLQNQRSQAQKNRPLWSRLQKCH
jgi:putative transposase